MKAILIKTPADIDIHESGVLLTSALAKELAKAEPGDIVYVFRGEPTPTQAHEVYRVSDQPEDIEPVKSGGATLVRLLPAIRLEAGIDNIIQDEFQESLSAKKGSWACLFRDNPPAQQIEDAPPSKPEVLVKLEATLGKKLLWRNAETHRFIWDPQTRTFRDIVDYLRAVPWEFLEAGLAARLESDQFLFQQLDEFLYQRGVAQLSSITWRHFEYICQKLVESMGFAVQRTQPSHDEGIDLIAEEASVFRARSTYVFSCKNWATRSVGIGPVRELDSLVGHFQAKQGVLLTTSTFTRDAIEYAKNKPLQLINGFRLRELLLTHNIP